MKSLRFKKILLLSYKEKKARIIEIDSDIVVVKGDNNKGKSCLLKSLYWALGCEPKSFPERWKKANVIALLYFTIDSVEYVSLHIGQEVHLFCNGHLLFKSKSYYPSKDFSSLLGIEINTAKNSKDNTLSKGAIFMPFYVDQDSGWESPWSSFNKIGTSSERHNAFFYHTGIIDENYFILKNKINAINGKLRTLNTKILGQQTFVNDVSRGLKHFSISISNEEFKEEIERFRTILEDLKEKQLSILRTLQMYYSKQSYYTVKLAQLHKDVDEMQKDLKYALEQENIVVCPTCGAKYDNNMINRYDISRDEFETKDLIIRYQDELEKIECAINKEKENAEIAQKEILKTQEIINTKKNEVSFKDYIESQANKRLMGVLLEKSQEYAEKKDKLESKYRELTEKLKKIGEKFDKKEILASFKSYVLDAFKKMGSGVSENTDISIGGKFSFSGSSLPRAIVAFHFSYFKIISKYRGPLMAPIVVDEPKQSGIVERGYQMLLEYMLKERPKKSQLILAIASESGMITDNESSTIIDLNKYDSLLIESDFEEVKSIIETLLAKNFSLSN